MAKYKVIGGMKGAFMPNFDSGVVDTKKEAREILREQKRRFKDDPKLEVVRSKKDSFEVERPSPTQINYRYEVGKVDEGLVDKAGGLF